MSYADELAYFLDYNTSRYWTYPEWIRQRTLERNMAFVVDRHRRETVGSIEDLRAVGLDIQDTLVSGHELLANRMADGHAIARETRDRLADLDGTVRAGFQGLDSSIERLGNNLVSALEWGFSDLSSQLTVLQDDIREILRVLQNPAATSAYEQFRTAREQARQHLYADALRSLSWAIHGNQVILGFATEYRFHLLRGVILLGDARFPSHDHVDPVEARGAFLRSAECSRADQPQCAAKAYVLAARAAFVSGQLAEAKQDVTAGLALTHNDPTGLFLLSRICFARGEFDDGEEFLRHALIIDPLLGIEDAALPEFGGDAQTASSRAIAAATQHHVNQLRAQCAEISSCAATLRRLSTREIEATTILRHELAELDEWLSTAQREAGGLTLIGAARLRSEAKDRRQSLNAFFDAFKQRANALLSEVASELSGQISEKRRKVEDLKTFSRNHFDQSISRYSGWIWVLCAFSALSGCSVMGQAFPGQVFWPSSASLAGCLGRGYSSPW